MFREIQAGFPVAKDIIGRLMPMDSFQTLIEHAQADGLIRDDVPAQHLVAALFGINQHFLAAAPVMRAKFGMDPLDPETLNHIIDTNLKILFTGIWSETEG